MTSPCSFLLFALKLDNVRVARRQRLARALGSAAGHVYDPAYLKNVRAK